MEIQGIKTTIFKENESLLSFIKKNVSKLHDGDIVVITSKIIALSQGRLDTLERKKIAIHKESKKVIKTKWAYLTLMDDGWCINAGIDESNIKNKIVLLPLNPMDVAIKIRSELCKKFSIKKLGVLITDTKSLPLRKGSIGRTLGWAGFEAIKSYIGKKDLFGRKSRVTQSNVADALSGSAVIVMGEGNEQIPIAIIKKAPVLFTSRNQRKEKLAFPSDKDIFGEIYKFTNKKDTNK